jgi:hypothetical protein
MGLLHKLFPPANREKFAQLITHAMRDAGEQREITFDPDAFCLRLGRDDGAHTVFLGNAYEEYCRASRSDRKLIIQRYGSFVQQRDEQSIELEQCLHLLLPRVRERFYHQVLKYMAGDDAQPQQNDSFPTRLLSEDLTVELAIDLPTSIATVSAKTLAEWGKTFDELLPIARENLWKISNQDFNQSQPGFYHSPWTDSHDASRLFLHDLIWQLKVRGQHVAMVPNRDLLMVTGSEDHENLARMGEIAEKVLQEQPRPMSGVAVRLEGASWVPFLPPQDSPAYVPLKRAAMRSMAMCYGEQTNLLQEWCKKTGQDIFVANHSIVQRDDGTWFSWAVWVEGVTDALMPQAEFIAFGGGKGGKKQLGWARSADVKSKLGHYLEPTKHYPPRWRVRKFPTPAELQALRLTAEPV